MSTLSGWSRGARVAAAATAVAGAGASLGGVLAVGVSGYFARRVLTPDRRRRDDIIIYDVSETSVTLSVTPDSCVPGLYGLWLNSGAGHARIGQILQPPHQNGKRTVLVRELLGVDFGELAPGPARWNQYYYGSPPDQSLGLTTENVTVHSDVGPMPAWVVPAAEPARHRWAVLIHGRGARREEAVRAIAPLRAEGWTCLVPSYRNDEGMPEGSDGRYNLGLSEWHDIEHAVRYAIERGAREILLVGWSMGGAIAMQFLARSSLANTVSGVVLDGAVLDWAEVIRFHARKNHLAPGMGALAARMMGHKWCRRLVGVHEPVDVPATNWVRQSEQLRHPMLIIHSENDDFVPIESARQLAAARPDLVRLEVWQTCRHCKEWNFDPQRWEHVVGEFARRST